MIDRVETILAAIIAEMRRQSEDFLALDFFMDEPPLGADVDGQLDLVALATAIARELEKEP